MKVHFFFKSFFSLIFLTIISVSGFGQVKKKSKFKLVGKLTNRDTGFVVLYYKDNLSQLIKDTTRVINGKFILEGNINYPTIARFSGEVKTDSFNDPNLTTLFLEPNLMSVEVAVDNFSNAKVTGSKTHEEYTSLLTEKEPYYNLLNSLGKNKANIEKTTRKNERVTLFKSLEDVELNFIKTHKNSIVSAYILTPYAQGTSIPLDSTQNLLDNLSRAVKNSVYGLVVSENLKIQRNVLALKVNSNQLGNVAFNFSRISNLNKEIKLSSFKNKNYVLLDFWASWCLYCVKSFPHLKKLSTLYASKGLKIITISEDYDFERWNEGIKKYKLDDFINIHDYETQEDLKTNNFANSISTRYAIEAIPTSILIDENGIIVGVYMADEHSEIPELDSKLEEIYK